MDLKSNLSFIKARRSSVAIEWSYNDDPPNIAVALKAEFSRDIAEAFKLGWLYAHENIPHDGFSTMSIDKDRVLFNVALKMESTDGKIEELFPEQVGGFSLHRRGDNKIGVSLKVNSRGNYYGVLSFFDHVKNGDFSFTISPRQKQLFEEGTAVDMTGPEHPHTDERAEAESLFTSTVQVIADAKKEREEDLKAAVAAAGPIPRDPNVAEWRSEEEVAAGVPRFILDTDKMPWEPTTPDPSLKVRHRIRCCL